MYFRTSAGLICRLFVSIVSVKELSAKRLVEISEYIANNPQFIVSGFRHSGILGALGRCQIEDNSELK